MLFFVLLGTVTSFAQSLQQGAQITSQANLVSGKPYLLYYVGNNGCYVKAIENNDYFKALAGDLVLTDEAIYYFIKDDTKWEWKIQSRKTSKYFPVPTKSTTFIPTTEEYAGSWELNFVTSGNVGNIAPSCVNGSTTYSLNRSRLSNGTSVLHGWTQGTAQANQLRIYEIALSTTSIVETGQEVSVPNEGTGESTLVTNQWYVLRKNGNFFIDSPANNNTTTTAPKGFGINNSQYLVRLESDGNGKYYVQTGYGNYLFTDNKTTRVSAVAFTETELLQLWEFHKLVNPLQPEASEVYTLNDTGSWIFVPNGFTNQYYLYNTVTNKFVSLSSAGTWTESDEAVPVILDSQGDSHYCITTKDGSKTFSINQETHMTIAKSRDLDSQNETDAAIIANRDNAMGELLCDGVSKLTLPTQITDNADALAADHTKGWFALRIHSDSNHPDYNGNFLYTLETENQANGRPHPMSHGGDYMKHPLNNDAAYYVRLWPVTGADNKTYYHWQVPSGKYVVNHNNDYPITWIRDASDFIIGQNTDDGTFYIQSSGYRTQICTSEYGDYLGKTASRYITSPTRLDIYPVNVTDAKLTPWKVIFNEGASDVKLHCTRNDDASQPNDIHGLTDVYHNGFFFLPIGEEPIGGPTLNDSQFKIGNEKVLADINTTDKTISVTYAPAVCIEPSGITVVQGSRTAGVGNANQVLLRMEVNPVAPCYPTAFNISLTGASSLSNVSAYLTASDQFHAEGVTKVPLASLENPSNGTIILNVPNEYYNRRDHLLMTGEHNYIWITATIKNDASVESNEVDASISSISYKNAADNANTCTITNGDPDGKMRIFYRQKYLWVSTDQNADVSRFYRNPVIQTLDDNNVLAFCEYRYDDVSELGKDYDDSNYGHRIDIVMSKSTDNGATWSTPVTIASGTDATEDAKASGFSQPAVVRTKNGKIICLAAMGQEAFDSNIGLRHIAIMTSTDGGNTWTAPVDIYDNIDWGEHSPSSVYITAGKGVTFNNGRIAFVLNERASNNSDEYVLYSDDEGDSWKFVPTSLFTNGKWGKLVVMNDDRLLATISRGTDAEYLERGKSTTTGSAAADGVQNWDTSDNNWKWNDLFSYGRNNDILYFQRGANGLATTDVMFHTVYNKVNNNDALRLYASFDQAASWKEFFTILPANASVSSMQTLSDGNLAIFFEDGSIGDGANGSYALNYVVIRKDLIDKQTTDLLSSVIIKEGETDTNAPYVNWSVNDWTKSFTTLDKTGFAGVVVSSSFDNAFNRETADSKRVICLKPSASGATDVITITAPSGYLIKSYTITAKNKDSETYTLTANGVSPVTLSGSTPQTFSVSNINSPSTTFSFTSASGSGSYALISNFVVELTKGYYVVKLNQVNPGLPGDRSYATLYTDYDLTQTDNATKAYYVTEVVNGKAKLTMTANEGRDIPKRTAVLLANSEGTTQTAFTVTENLTPVVEENLLKGTLTGMTLEMSTHTNLYSFGRRRPKGSNDNWVAGFYNNGKDITLNANRCYLETPVPPVQSANGFDLTFDEEEVTGIAPQPPLLTSPEGDGRGTESEAWFDLNGRKLGSRPTTKGLYIKNGRKVVIK